MMTLVGAEGWRPSEWASGEGICRWVYALGFGEGSVRMGALCLARRRSLLWGRIWEWSLASV